MHALAKLCIRRPVFATMLVMSLVVTGMFSYFNLGVDLFPSIDIPTVEVITSDPGASPEAVETEITKKMEDAVNTISQIDELRSTSSEGQSLVMIQFELSKNGDIAAEEVQNHIGQISNDLPRTARTPVVIKFDPDATPILQIAVSANRPLRDLTMIADKLIKQKLENAAGVGQVKIVGGARREIHILTDPDKLRAYNLTITDVFNAMRAQNLELPGGSLQAGTRELTVRTTGRVTDASQFSQLAIVNRNGYTVKVRHRNGGRQLRRTTNLRAARWPARRDARRLETIGRELGRHFRRRQGAPHRPHSVPAQRRPRRNDRRPIHFHQGIDQKHPAPPDRRQHSGVADYSDVPHELAHHPDRLAGDSDIDHLGVRPDGGHGT
jgi:hypothetical protein